MDTYTLVGQSLFVYSPWFSFVCSRTEGSEARVATPLESKGNNLQKAACDLMRGNGAKQGGNEAESRAVCFFRMC